MPLTDDRAIEIIMEETQPNRPRTRVGVDPEEDAYREAIRRDVEQQRKDGIEVVMPAD